jgi:hypothetical protein
VAEKDLNPRSRRGSPINPHRWAIYDKARADGWSQKEAALKAGISVPSAWRHEKLIREQQGSYSPGDKVSRRLKKSGGGGSNPAHRAYQPGVGHEIRRGAIPRSELSPIAADCLEDFARFRRRYFGRRSTPWQEEAGHQIKDFLATRDKEYVVDNCPPGSGKTTLFTMDIPAWLTCRNRGIRGLMGSAAQTLAENYLRRLRTALESPYLVRAESEEMEQGLAYDAETTLIEDYGLFKPEGSVLWTAQAFIVAQLDDRPITEKEPTWSAYGLDTTFIGGRFDFCVWDDATTDKHLRTVDQIDKQRETWDKVAEKRLEPGGLLVLAGQRLSPEDLYRHCLNKRVGSSTEAPHDGCCQAEPGKKYHHIIFKSHYEDRCTDDHTAVDYYPRGCLLDPYRLPWRELESEMENSASNFQQVFQQQDLDPAQVLVDPFWIKGGIHPTTGEVFPGCWDHERAEWEIPQLSLPYVAYITVDPSPKNMWGIELWVYHPQTKLRFLVALHNSKMMINQFFDWNDPDKKFTGLLPEWYQKSVMQGFPITTLIFEANAAQRFFLATEALRRWQQQTGVRIIGHETYAANKLDPELGPQILRELYRRGLVRLPGKGDHSKFRSMRLTEEVTRYPMGRTDDLVMSQWFGEANLDHIYKRDATVRITNVPSWLKRQTA